MRDEPEAGESMLLRRDQAEALAKRAEKEPDDIDVAPSLLSSEDINRYVQATGMVSPFFSSETRMKRASYEDRIGFHAYAYKNSTLVEIDLEKRQSLLVPANSIVFVESYLDYRLPPYIAVRFNLHINHVHRGLLLGTGPLVDPGFWGKLCIPLHNLTSEDYEIPLSEGLIWVEFTKTTGSGVGGRDPTNDGYWDILKFINKAARGVIGTYNVPIQSSIPIAVTEAKATTRIAKGIARTVAGIGIVSIAAAAFGIFYFLGSFVQNTYTAMNGHRQAIEAQLAEERGAIALAAEELSASARRLEELETRIVALEGANSVGLSGAPEDLGN